MKSLLNRISVHINRILVARAESGPYRFLIKSWGKKTNFGLAERILNAEYFKDDIVPLSLPIQQFKRIVILSPHQDDEVIGAGGTLLLAKSAGAKIQIIYTTDGGYANFPLPYEETVQIRFQEAQVVSNMLGAEISTLKISNYYPKPNSKNLEKLAKEIIRAEPDLVLVPWLLDSPPKHRLANHMLAIANQQFDLPDFEIWGYQVHNTPFVNGYVDISQVIEQKKELLALYKLVLKYDFRYDHSIIGLNAWNSRFITTVDHKPEKRFVEVFFTLPKADYLKLVQEYYEKDLQATYGSDSKVLNGTKGMLQELKAKQWL